MPKNATSSLDHEVLECPVDGYDYSIISEAKGLTQFGVDKKVSRLRSKSLLRLWHGTNDEMIYSRLGEFMPIGDHEALLNIGNIPLWPTSTPIEHCFENRSCTDADYHAICTHNQTDNVLYPDHTRISMSRERLAIAKAMVAPYPERTLK